MHVDVEALFRVVAIGDARSGKTSFFTRVFTDRFEENYIPTIGRPEIQISPFRVGNFNVKLNVSDMPGTERFRSSTYHVPLRLAPGIIIFGDATNISSLKNMELHLVEVDKFCANKNCAIMFIINKIDSPHPEYEAFKQNLAFLAKRSFPLYEVSVKNSINIFEPLADLVASMIWIKQQLDAAKEPPKQCTKNNGK